MREVSEGVSSPVQSSCFWSSAPLGHLSHRVFKVSTALIGIRVGFGLFPFEKLLLLKIWSSIWEVQTFWTESLYLHAVICMNVYNGKEVCVWGISLGQHSLFKTYWQHYAEVKGAFWCILCRKALSRRAPVEGSASWSPLAQLSSVWTSELLPGGTGWHLFLSAQSALWGCWCC